MNQAERESVLAQIGEILEDEIHGQLMELYAAAVAATEKQPDQVNNEMRNVITHFARAFTADNINVSVSEMNKAKSHIERAKRDAVKIAVMYLRGSSDQLCVDIRRANGIVDCAFLARRDMVAHKRKELLKAEIRGEDVINGFVELYLEADKLNDDLKVEFGLTGKRLPRWRYQIHAFRRHTAAVLVGLFMGVVVTVVAAILIPDTPAFGHWVRQRLGIEPEPKRAQTQPIQTK